MAQPAVKGPAKGNHVLFIVRNANGVSAAINYLNSRSIKSWTSTSLNDAIPKIKNHNIQIVFISLSLKNISIFGVVEAIKSQFNVPVVIFSEETSRKIETDMAKMVTPHKIVPPNHNSKFLQAIQLNLGALGKSSGLKSTTSGNVEELLPQNAEEIDGLTIPTEGRWLKINTDDKAVAPFTYKLIQPRNATIGRTRYFFLGPKNPEENIGGRGWLGKDGEFFVAGRIVEAKPDPEAAPRKLKAVKNEPEAADPEWLPQAGELEDPVNETVSSRQHLPSVTRKSTVTGRASKKIQEIGDSFKQGLENLSAQLPDFGSFVPKLPELAGLLDGLPNFAEIVDKVLGRSQPSKTSQTQEPTSLLERKLLKASLSAVTRPHKDVPLSENTLVEKIGLAYVKTDAMTGFIISEMNNFSEQNFATFDRLIDVLKTRYARDGQAMELILPPAIVSVEPLLLVAIAKANSHFLIHAENETDRLVCSFVEAGDIPRLQGSPEHEKLIVVAGALNPEMRLTFNVYVHMPKNEKHIQYLRTGQLPPTATVEKLSQSPTTELLIDPSAAASYYAYVALTALKQKKN